MSAAVGPTTHHEESESSGNAAAIAARCGKKCGVCWQQWAMSQPVSRAWKACGAIVNNRTVPSAFSPMLLPALGGVFGPAPGGGVILPGPAGSGGGIGAGAQDARHARADSAFWAVRSNKVYYWCLRGRRGAEISSKGDLQACLGSIVKVFPQIF